MFAQNSGNDGRADDPITAAMDDVDRRLQSMRTAVERTPEVPLEVRRDRLRRLIAVLQDSRSELLDAIGQDFGQRSAIETQCIELTPLIMGIRSSIRQLPHWMDPSRRRSVWATLPASACVDYVPLGVVGVMSPWNYPLLLALGPTADALGAGNRVLVKPSEHVPRTSEWLQTAIAKRFDADELSVHPGGVELAKHFSQLPFDHLVFTGSTEVGREVMRAASASLVPVTLELGGQSPAWIDPACSLDSVVPALLRGKLLNAGQTCVSPNHLYIANEQLAQFEALAPRCAQALYPAGVGDAHFTSIISDGHVRRLSQLVEDAVEKGARRVDLFSTSQTPRHPRSLAPCLLMDATPDMRVMQEEIFGPILPVIGFEGNAKNPLPETLLQSFRTPPHPLVLIAFSERSFVLNRFRRETRSGMLVANAPLIHAAQDDLPMTGIGHSGMGRYHGHDGFLSFSHARSYYRQRRPNLLSWVLPPFDHPWKAKLLSVLERWA